MDDRFSEACVIAQQRATAATLRLRAAQAELDTAEREYRCAYDALDAAEALYYQQPDSATRAPK